MAAPLKTAGLRELRALRVRTDRQRAMRRISPEDHEYIETRINEIEARIISMREEGTEDGY